MSKVVAKRYSQWIDAFTKLVSDKQKEIQEIEKQQSLYVVAKDVMEDVNLTNEVRIELSRKGVSINVALLKNDRVTGFDEIAAKISQELVRKKLHDGQFAMNNPVGSALEHSDPFAITWTWTLFGKNTYSKLVLRAGYTPEGTADIVVLSSEKTHSYSYTKYTPIWRKDLIDTKPVRRSAELDV
jgi:hypothetical protein